VGTDLEEIPDYLQNDAFTEHNRNQWDLPPPSPFRLQTIFDGISD